MSRIAIALITVPLLLFMQTETGARESRLDLVRNAQKVLFLGDSITYAGGYVSAFETWLELEHPNDARTVINVGLPSETVSGLSEEGHAGGRFPRPDLDERLDRVLSAIQPDLVIACYGINCGIYQPLDESRFDSYKAGILNLQAKVSDCGAKLILITPPTYDLNGKERDFDYDDVLTAYSDWLINHADADWMTFDLHREMKSELASRREQNPEFTFQPDSVHPNTAGHSFIASRLINWFSEGRQTAAIWPESMTDEDRAEFTRLINERMITLRNSWLSETGHERPGIAGGLPVEQAEARAAEINEQLRTLRRAEDGIADTHIGVYYYPWYVEGDWTRHEYEGTPELGNYGTDSPEIAAQHIHWCADAGIDSLFVSWWGEDDICAQHMRAGLLEASNLNRIKFAIIYESLGRLDAKDGLVDTRVDFAAPDVLATMKVDFKVLAENYFNHPQYLRFDGRPVVAMYVTRTFRNLTAEDVNAVRDYAGVDFYLIGDEPFFGRQKSPDTAINDTGCFDAVTAYNMLENPRAVEGESSLQYHLRDAFPVYEEWAEKVDLIPGIFPSYKDFRGNKRLTGNAEEFKSLLRESRRFALNHNSNAPATILVTSFNEWWEGTTIEPAMEYGHSYLDAIREFKNGN